jgi:hypothetical protein
MKLLCCFLLKLITSINFNYLRKFHKSLRVNGILKNR